MNEYTIIVQNNSGSNQQYALFQTPPSISIGGVQPKIWTNVFATGLAPDTQSTNFTMYKQYYGVVGQSKGKPGDAVTVTVSGQRPVTLGNTNADGTQVPGTTLALEIVSIGDKQAPTYAQTNSQPSGSVNAFSITTPAFQAQTAMNSELPLNHSSTRIMLTYLPL